MTGVAMRPEVPTPKGESLVMIRKSYLAICDGDPVAASLLNEAVHTHNGLVKAGRPAAFRRTSRVWRERLLNVFGEAAIRKALHWLSNRFLACKPTRGNQAGPLYELRVEALKHALESEDPRPQDYGPRPIKSRTRSSKSKAHACRFEDVASVGLVSIHARVSAEQEDIPQRQADALLPAVEKLSGPLARLYPGTNPGQKWHSEAAQLCESERHAELAAAWLEDPDNRGRLENARTPVVAVLRALEATQEKARQALQEELEQRPLAQRVSAIMAAAELGS